MSGLLRSTIRVASKAHSCRILSNLRTDGILYVHTHNLKIRINLNFSYFFHSFQLKVCS